MQRLVQTVQMLILHKLFSTLPPPPQFLELHTAILSLHGPLMHGPPFHSTTCNSSSGTVMLSCVRMLSVLQKGSVMLPWGGKASSCKSIPVLTHLQSCFKTHCLHTQSSLDTPRIHKTKTTNLLWAYYYKLTPPSKDSGFFLNIQKRFFIKLCKDTAHNILLPSMELNQNREPAFSSADEERML